MSSERASSVAGLALGLWITAVAFVALLTGAVPHSRAEAAGAVRASGNQERARSAITMHVEAGWQNRFRGRAAWTPVRVTVHNNGRTALSGTLEIPDSTVNAAMQLRVPSRAVYRESITVPENGTKSVVLYIPGIDIQQQVDVDLRDRAGLVGSVSVFPTSFDDSAITVAAASRDPQSIAWLTGVRHIGHSQVTVVTVPGKNLDPYPQALASFDLVVLSNLDAARLTGAQRSALERYARDGGSLLLVGGPDWQETLRPLPSALLPGTVTSSMSAPLRGLASFVGHPPAAGATGVSVLTHAQGAVLAAQGGVPLVVRKPFGIGSVEYIAFDPALDPIAEWTGAGNLATRIVQSATPGAMRRVSMPHEYTSVSFINPPSNAIDVQRELANVASSPIAGIATLLGILILYLVVIGPANLLILRHLRRPGMAWFSIPLVAAVFCSLVVGVSAQSRNGSLTLNAIGTVYLDGTGQTHPATLYVGLLAPRFGTFHVVYDSSGLATPIVPASSSDAQSGTRRGTSSWGFEQGVKTAVDLVSMPAQTVKAASLQTDVHIRGDIRGKLRVDRWGDIVGTIRNETSFRLLEPAIVAGRSWIRLPDLRAGETAAVRVHPVDDVQRHDYSPMLFKVYGRTTINGPEPVGDEDRNVSDRIRDTASTLPEGNVVSMLGEVTFLAWTTHPLGRFSVDGRPVSPRSLVLIAKPLSVGLSPGRVRLSTGIFGAHLVDQTFSVARYACCGPSAQAVYVGAGGEATFEFDLPQPARARFTRLTLSLYAGGQDASYTGYADVPRNAVTVYDWRRLRWQPVDFRNGIASLPSPGRYVSFTGAMLVKLAVRSDSSELTIADPLQDLQLMGSAIVA